MFNGVCQGAVSSPLFFSVYVNKLILRIHQLGIGCKIAGQFYGILVYADDIFLLSPSREGLQSMIKECEKFAEKRGLAFSVNPDEKKSKTKCIIFSRHALDITKIEKIKLNSMNLPWVTSLLHLGNTIDDRNTMNKDICIKRAKLIGKISTLNQEFYFTSPDVRMKLYEKYCLSIYGSNLWALFSNETSRVYKTWNVSTRICYSLPRTTHCYFVESVSKCVHLKTLLCARFATFDKALMNCKKPSVRVLASLCRTDTSTVYGNNLFTIAKLCETSINELSSQCVKAKMEAFPCPEKEK